MTKSRTTEAAAMVLRSVVLLLSLILAGCSGSGGGGSSASGAVPPRASAGAPGATSGAGGSGPGLPPLTVPSAGGSQAAGASAPGATGAPLALPSGFRPSGARVRIANLYRSGPVADPGPIDVYGDFGNGEGTPLLIVPYGTMSDWFDPGIIDDQRDARITIFAHGVHGFNSEIASQSETLAGTERISMFLAGADTKNASGQAYGSLRVVFEISTLDPLPVPPAGQAAVILDLLTLAELPGAKDGYVYLSAGGDCLASLGGGGDGPQPLSGGNTVRFAIPVGPQVLTFHPDGTDCHGPGLYDGIPVALTAGQRAYVVPFAIQGKSVRSLVVPIEP